MQIIKQQDKKGELSGIILKGVKFYYTMIRNPSPIYDDRKLTFEKARKEYKVTIGVNEEIADAWDEIFGKQPSKKMTTEKFLETFKVDSDVDGLPVVGEKKQYTIRVTQRERRKDGSFTKQPKVFLSEDGKVVEITNDKNVGNASEGDVKIRVLKNDYGYFAYLDKMLISSLNEYETNDGGLSQDDVDFLGTDNVELSTTERKASSKVKGDDDAASTDDDDLPWDEDKDEDY